MVDGPANAAAGGDARETASTATPGAASGPSPMAEAQPPKQGDEAGAVKMPKAMSDAELGDSNDGDQDAVEKSHGLLILLRHGESMWNRSSEHPDRLWRYAGSNDVALSEQGIHEALEAGDRLAKIHIDVVFASCLSRAMNTCMIALAKHVSGLTPIIANREGSYAAGIDAVSKLPENTVVPIICSEKLNERCFGELQGMPSTEHLVRYKKEYLQEVRNKFDVRFPGPKGESTEDVFHRVVPYFEENILPLLRKGKNVLLCSHGFSIRALIKYLDGMSDEEFNLEMRKEKRDPENCKLLAATGVPLLYRFDRFAEDGLHPKKIGAIDRAYELAHTCAPY